jgi:hypothetical protein
MNDLIKTERFAKLIAAPMVEKTIIILIGSNQIA